jgi:hypothetical protein
MSDDTNVRPFRQPLLIPRAEKTIAQSIAKLRIVSFEQDPLMSMEESFTVSVWDSAKKRDGAVIESAIMDAIDQTPALRLLPVSRIEKRKVDVQFEVLANNHLVALEIKRGPLQDSKAIERFRNDLIRMPAILQQVLPSCPVENIHFHVVFASGVPPIHEGLTIANLKKLYGLDATLHVDTARRLFGRAVRAVIGERR